LEKNPWYETRWKSQLEKLPRAERDEMLFMLAARWADEIRTDDKAESHPLWHYVDFPFKPEGEPVSIQVVVPPPENILSAIAENQRIVQSGSDSTKRGIALSWLHLIGDVHKPLHAVQLFSRKYPHGERGGGDSCVHVAQDRAPLSLHRLWDGLITFQQQHSEATKHSNRATEPVYQVGPLRACCGGTGSMGEREFWDRNQDRLPERRIAWDSERETERLP